MTDDDSDDDDFLDTTSRSSNESQSGGAQYKVKSYYINRLKQYDPELFVFQVKKWQTNKKGEKTSRYSYQSMHRVKKNKKNQPIAVTDEELEIINKTKGSGLDSYSYPLTIPGRPQNIKYICPQYWDIASNLKLSILNMLINLMLFPKMLVKHLQNLY